MLRKLNAMPLGQILAELQLKSHVLPLGDVLAAQQGLEDLIFIVFLYTRTCAAMKSSHKRMTYHDIPAMHHGTAMFHALAYLWSSL